MSINSNQSSRVSALLERVSTRRNSRNATIANERADETSGSGYSEELFEEEEEPSRENTTPNVSNMNTTGAKMNNTSRKNSFSTINTNETPLASNIRSHNPNVDAPKPAYSANPTAQTSSNLTECEDLKIRLLATTSDKNKLVTDLESAHRQIEDLRNSQNKLKIRNERQVKVLNSTIASLRSERDAALTSQRDTEHALETSKKLVQQLQCTLDDQNATLQSMKQSHFLADKNAKDIISTERRIAFDQIKEADTRVSIAMEQLDDTRAGYAVKESNWEDQKAVFQNALDDSLNRCVSLQQEVASLKTFNDTLKGRVDAHSEREHEIRDDLHSRMKLQLEAESKAVKQIAEADRCKQEVLAVRAETEKVITTYKQSIDFEQNRAKLAEDHLHGTMKDFAVIRTNMAKEISVLASDRESAISSLHAIQDRLELTEERCGAFQKQLTSARGELANTNRTLAEVSNVHSAMNPLIKAPSKPPPLHNIAVRELTDVTIAEQQELRRRAEERLGEKKELEALRKEKMRYAEREQELEAVRTERAEFEVLMEERFAEFERKQKEGHLMIESSGASSGSATTSASSSRSASPESVKSSRAIASVDGGGSSKGSGKKKRRVEMKIEDAARVVVEREEERHHHSQHHGQHHGQHHKHHKLHHSAQQDETSAFEIAELKSQLEAARTTILEYEEKLNISTTEIHHFRKMSTAGKEEMERLKASRTMTAEQEEVAENERLTREHEEEVERLREEQEKFRRKSVLHVGMGDRHKRDAEKYKQEREVLEKRKEETERELGKARERANTLGKEWEAKHSTALEEVAQHKSGLDQVRREKEELQNSVKSLANEKTMLLNERGMLAGKIEDGSREIARLGEKVKEIKAQKEAAEKAKRDADRGLKDLKVELAGKNDEVEEEREKAAREIGAEKSKAEGWKRKVTELEEKVRAVDDVKEKLEEAEDDLRRAKRERDGLKDKVEGLKKRNAGLVQEMEEGAAGGRVSLVNVNAVSSGSVGGAEAARGGGSGGGSGSTSMSASKTELPFNALTIKTLSTALQQAEGEVASLRSSLTGAQNREAVAKKHLSSSLHALAKVEGQLNALKSNPVGRDASLANASVKTLKAQLAAAQVEVGELKKQLLSERSQHDKDISQLGKRLGQRAVEARKMRPVRGSSGVENVPVVNLNSSITLSDLKQGMAGIPITVVTPLRGGGGSEGGSTGSSSGRGRGGFNISPSPVGSVSVERSKGLIAEHQRLIDEMSNTLSL
ncbi:hypothetical protein TrST_g3266 [Triparma strigata]|uniref:Uncharacterized protein n=1 Tax=Triparma strigata TaxID=1606541 RepID=A0A9W7EYI9_9STRA|nr:hypothetical protein TrST_g3266 [Triparma strigata]